MRVSHTNRTPSFSGELGSGHRSGWRRAAPAPPADSCGPGPHRPARPVALSGCGLKAEPGDVQPSCRVWLVQDNGGTRRPGRRPSHSTERSLCLSFPACEVSIITGAKGELGSLITVVGCWLRAGGEGSHQDSACGSCFELNSGESLSKWVQGGGQGTQGRLQRPELGPSPAAQVC